MSIKSYLLLKFRHAGYECEVHHHSIEPVDNQPFPEVRSYNIEPFPSELGAYSIWSWYTAYVTVPQSHPDFDKDFDYIPVRVHGGLSYGEKGKFGFDTNHGERFTMKEIIAEVKSLALQLAKRDPNWARGEDPIAYEKTLERFHKCNDRVWLTREK